MREILPPWTACPTSPLAYWFAAMSVSVAGLEGGSPALSSAQITGLGDSGVGGGGKGGAEGSKAEQLAHLEHLPWLLA